MHNYREDYLRLLKQNGEQAERIKELEADNKSIENLAKTRFAKIEIYKELVGKLMGIIEEIEQALKGEK